MAIPFVEFESNKDKGTISVRLEMEIARLTANVTAETLEQIVRKEAVSILMADEALKHHVHELALAYLMKLAALPAPPADSP